MKGWEEKYRDGETPWDHGGPSPVLGEMIEKVPRRWWGEGEVLVPGCGFGHDVALLAGAGIAAVGLDLSPTAIAGARRRHDLAADRFVVGDLLAGEELAGRPFGAVWEHTCLCSMAPDRWDDYRRAVARLLPPGRCLLGVFYVDPLPRDDGLPGPPFGASPERLRGLLDGDFELLRHWVPERGFESRLGREWAAVFRRR